MSCCVILREQNIAFNWYHGRSIASNVLRNAENHWLQAACCLPHNKAFLRQAYGFGKVYTVSSIMAYPVRFLKIPMPSLQSSQSARLYSADQKAPGKVRDRRHSLPISNMFVWERLPGIASGYKPDGTIFHHGGYIPQLSKRWRSIHLARILRLLSGHGVRAVLCYIPRIRAIPGNGIRFFPAGYMSRLPA